MFFEVAHLNAKIMEIPIEFKKRQTGESRLMRGAIDYAIRAWALNLRIMMEYSAGTVGVFFFFVVLVLAFASSYLVNYSFSVFV